MTRDEVKAKLLEGLESVGPAVEVSGLDHAAPMEAQGVDSLDMVNFLLEIEERFGVKIDDDTAAKLESIDKIVDHVHAAVS